MTKQRRMIFRSERFMQKRCSPVDYLLRVLNYSFTAPGRFRGLNNAAKWIDEQNRNHRDQNFGRVQGRVGDFIELLKLFDREILHLVARQAELPQISLKRYFLAVIDQDDPVKEIVPVTDDDKQRNGRQTGHGDRDEDLEQDFQRTGTVNECGLLQLLRNSLEEVHQENHVEDWNRTRKNQRPDAVDQPQLADHHIPGNDPAAEEHRKHDNPHVFVSRSELRDAP